MLLKYYNNIVTPLRTYKLTPLVHRDFNDTAMIKLIGIYRESGSTNESYKKQDKKIRRATGIILLLASSLKLHLLLYVDS